MDALRSVAIGWCARLGTALLLATTAFGGLSPSTVAAEIAGLVCAGDIARRNGDTAVASRYGIPGA
jgi:hypothetical protein